MVLQKIKLTYFKKQNKNEKIYLASALSYASSFTPVAELMSKEREKWNPKICV
jgi:hypothetical protein